MELVVTRMQLTRRVLGRQKQTRRGRWRSWGLSVCWRRGGWRRGWSDGASALIPAPGSCSSGKNNFIQGVCRQSAKAKLKNRHFNGAYRGSKPFFLTLQTGLKFPVDKRNIKDVYYSQFQQQENSAKLQILHFWRCLKTWSFALYWP